jgi:hypothetical protein
MGTLPPAELSRKTFLFGFLALHFLSALHGQDEQASADLVLSIFATTKSK